MKNSKDDSFFMLSQKFIVLWFCICGVLAISMMSFGIWVIIKVLSYFGII